MAEFLIYNKEHWMDSLTQKEIDEQVAKNEHFMDKYNARYQKGDIVEVQPNGFWTDGKRKGFGFYAFALVTIPNMSLKECQFDWLWALAIWKMEQ